MKAAILTLILAMCLVASVLTYLNDKATNSGLPLVHAGLIAPACPRLTNPCDRVNCNRINTRNIA
jgi:hypothetical protein